MLGTILTCFIVEVLVVIGCMVSLEKCILPSFILELWFVNTATKYPFLSLYFGGFGLLLNFDLSFLYAFKALKKDFQALNTNFIVCCATCVGKALKSAWFSLASCESISYSLGIVPVSKKLCLNI